MILDSEDQRSLILQALTNVTIQAAYAGLCEIFPKMRDTIEAVKGATITEVSNGGK